MFSNVRSVLLQCNTRLRLLHLLYDIEVMWRKTIKHTFSMFYTLIKHGFLTNQSDLSIYLSLYIYLYIAFTLQHCNTHDIPDKNVTAVLREIILKLVYFNKMARLLISLITNNTVAVLEIHVSPILYNIWQLNH